MEYASSREWSAGLAAAVAKSLARWPEIGDPAPYRVDVKDCPAHGPACVQVLYATAIIEHVHWQEVDPAALAARLLARMLPLYDEESGGT